MSLTVRSTEIHIHPGSKPNFAIASAEHPQGAWVVSQDPNEQLHMFEAAELARNFNTYVEITFDRYEEADQDRRFYWGVTQLVYGVPTHSTGAAAEEKIVKCWPGLKLGK